MEDSFHKPVAPVTASMLPFFEWLTGIACLVRDEQRLEVKWCNDAYARLCQRPIAEVIGTVLADRIPTAAADERESTYRQVISTNQPTSVVQFGADMRLLCHVHPIDPASFGHRGVLIILHEAPIGTSLVAFDANEQVWETPCLDGLDALSVSELRVLYWTACGMQSKEIAAKLCRAMRTVENHLSSIHKKLGTDSRSMLVHFATERGIHAFSADEWDRLIGNRSKVRQSAKPSS